jgi:hypothetical protein
MMTTVLLWAILQAPEAKPQDPFVEKVADSMRSRLSDHLTKASGSKVTLEDALSQMAKLDEVLVEEVAKKLNASPADVRDAWKKRDRKSKRVSYGTGSWIVEDGQDGGLDSDVKGTPVPEENIMDRTPSILSHRKPPPPSGPVPLGKPLKTKAEWWTASSAGERAAFLEAEWARKSTLVEKKEEPKKCQTCNGKGSLNTNRGGMGLTIVCSRCHGAKDDLVVVYE